jgi:hypothetical protein
MFFLFPRSRSSSTPLGTSARSIVDPQVRAERARRHRRVRARDRPTRVRRVDAERLLEQRAVPRGPGELDDEALARLDHANHATHGHRVLLIVYMQRLSRYARAEVCSSMPSFRHDYLTYDELTAVLKGWEKDHPDVCSLRSIGRSEQGASNGSS